MKITETKKDYHIYHKEVFGVEPSKIPNQVFIIENDNYVIGFVSGHRNFDGLFYIEYAGILPKFQKGYYLRYIESALEKIGGGFVSAVNNQNLETIKILTAMKFVIIGFRTVENKSYVEFARNK